MVLHKESLDTDKEEYGNQHSTVANAYFNMGIGTKRTGESCRVHGVISAIIAYHEEEEESLPVANAYNCTTTVLRKQGKHDSAMELLKKSLGIKRLVLGEVDSSIAGDAEHCDHIETEWQAERSANLFQESIDITTKSMGENHPFVAVGCRNMALVLDIGVVRSCARHLQSQSWREAYLGGRCVQ